MSWSVQAEGNTRNEVIEQLNETFSSDDENVTKAFEMSQTFVAQFMDTFSIQKAEVKLQGHVGDGNNSVGIQIAEVR